MLSHEVHRVGYTNPGADMESTVSHNTIVVDEKNSATNPSAPSVLLDRKEMPAFLVTENKESRLYPDVDFSRVLAIFDGIFFVGDKWRAADGKTHTFDWPFYAPWQPWGKAEEWDFTVPGDFKTPFPTSYQFVKSAFSAPASDGMKASVPIPPSTLEKGFDVNRKSDRRLSMNFALPQKTEAVKFRIGRGHQPKPGPMLLLRQKGEGAEFGAAFEVVKNGGTERIQSVKSLPFEPADPLSAVWEVRADSGVYHVVVNRTGKELKWNGNKTKQMLEVIKE